MRNLKTIEVPGVGPEDTLFDAHGNLYCSLRDNGHIVRVNLVSGEASVCADTGGAPLGLDWLPDGRLLVCNGTTGLQAINISTGEVASLPCDIQFGVCNNACVLADGTILVSDSSSQYPLADFQKDIIENTASGRLIRLSPDGRATVLLDQLSFANGVVCVDSTVLVAQTGNRLISKVSLDGSQAGVFASVPGHPDNLSIGSDGNIWVAVPSLPSKLLAVLHKMPVAMRRMSARLPVALQPKPELCCLVAVYDPSGKLLKTYNGDTGIFNFVTGVREQRGVVALGSIEHSCVGVFDVD